MGAESPSGMLEASCQHLRENKLAGVPRGRRLSDHVTGGALALIKQATQSHGGAELPPPRRASFLACLLCHVTAGPVSSQSERSQGVSWERVASPGYIPNKRPL